MLHHRKIHIDLEPLPDGEHPADAEDRAEERIQPRFDLPALRPDRLAGDEADDDAGDGGEEIRRNRRERRHVQPCDEPGRDERADDEPED